MPLLLGFYWLKSGGRLGGSPIQQFSVAYTVSLMRGLMPPDRSRDPASVTAMVASFPPHRRATVAPWDVPAPAHWDLPFAWCERFLPEVGDA